MRRPHCRTLFLKEPSCCRRLTRRTSLLMCTSLPAELHTHALTHALTRTHTHTHILTQRHAHTPRHALIHSHTHSSRHTHAHIYPDTHTPRHTYTLIHSHTHTHIYIPTHLHTYIPHTYSNTLLSTYTYHTHIHTHPAESSVSSSCRLLEAVTTGFKASRPPGCCRAAPHCRDLITTAFVLSSHSSFFFPLEKH